MSTITRAALRAMLAEIKGARIVSMEVETLPKWKGGKSSPMAGVVKRSKVSAMVNWVYANAKAKVEGVDPSEVEVGERPWGKHIKVAGASGQPRLTPFVAHGPTFVEALGGRSLLTIDEIEVLPDAEVYVEAKVQSSLSHEYVAPDGRILTDAEVADYLPPKRDNPTGLADYRLVSIRKITHNGETYAVA